MTDGAMYIAICDDERAQADHLARLVRLICPDAKIAVFSSAEALLLSYDEGFDALLLDIEMERMSGMELARRLREEGKSVAIIFVTGYAEHMAEGYDVAATHYLMKPVSPEKLASALDRARAGAAERSECVLLDAGGEKLRLALAEVTFAEAFSHTVQLHTLSGEFAVRASLSELERTLGSGFIRCHRCYIAGLRHIRSIGREFLTLEDGARVPVSRRAYGDVNQAFIRYFRG